MYCLAISMPRRRRAAVCIITRAEMRMARPSQRGIEAATRTSDTSSLDDIGLDRRRIAEWRDVRDGAKRATRNIYANKLFPIGCSLVFS